MLNENQKERLINQICGIVKESMMENSYFENMFREKGEDNSKQDSKDSDSKETSNKRESVLKWLDTAQELHSVLAYGLWHNKDKDTARSEFSKKYRGQDNEGNPYHFDDDEINTLYNMRDDFIERAGFTS